MNCSVHWNKSPIVYMVECSFPFLYSYPNSTILKMGRDSYDSLSWGELQTLQVSPETPSQCNKALLLRGGGPGGSGHLRVCQNESLRTATATAEESCGHCSFEKGRHWKLRNRIHMSYCLRINQTTQKDKVQWITWNIFLPTVQPIQDLGNIAIQKFETYEFHC